MIPSRRNAVEGNATDPPDLTTTLQAAANITGAARPGGVVAVWRAENPGPPGGRGSDPDPAGRSVDASGIASATLGPPQDWPDGLRIALGTCLAHPTPMAVLWGSASELMYNDACAALLDSRHPEAWGRPVAEGWPQLAAAMDRSCPDGPGEGRLSLAAPDGTRIELRWTAAPIPLPDGTRGGTLVVLQPSGDGAVLASGPDGEPSGPGSPGTAGRADTPADPDNPDDPDDLADLSSLDVGTICSALGRLTVPGRAAWAIAWIRRTDRAGRIRLDRRDLPPRRRRRVTGTAALAEQLGVGLVIESAAPVARSLPGGHGVPAGPVLTVPLRDKRRVVGALTLGQPVTRGPAAEDRVQDLADRAGVALANAIRFQVEHSISRDLQRLLAPRPLPAIRGVDLAARLIAGAPGITVGGDWYDASVLPDGRLALTVGDVVGHGLRPAVEMLRLRTGVRNLALEGLLPAEVLAGTDEFLRRTGDLRFVTCLHALYRPDTGLLEMANAGHLRPVHLRLDGRPLPVPMGAGLPLGGAAELAKAGDRGPVGTCRMTLQPGEAILMFTDGLVEGPAMTVEDGIERLLQALGKLSPTPPPRGRSRGRRRRRDGSSAGPTAREWCDLALDAMVDGRKGDRDDVAVLVLRRRSR
jgi:hypothetical protein